MQYEELLSSLWRWSASTHVRKGFGDSDGRDDDGDSIDRSDELEDEGGASVENKNGNITKIQKKNSVILFGILRRGYDIVGLRGKRTFCISNSSLTKNVMSPRSCFLNRYPFFFLLTTIFKFSFLTISHIHEHQNAVFFVCLEVEAHVFSFDATKQAFPVRERCAKKKASCGGETSC